MTHKETQKNNFQNDDSSRSISYGIDKGIGELKNMRLTAAEKAAMLEHIFKAPIASPYQARPKVYAYVRRFSAAIALSLIVVLTSGSLALASERSLPGEKLYSLKTKVLEPLRGALAVTPVKKLEWEEKKVARRLAEAEKLAAKDRLEDDEIENLGMEIEKSSSAFAKKAEEISLDVATSSDGKKAKEAQLKEAFKEKLESEENKNDESNESKMENREDFKNESGKKSEEDRREIKKLKERAVKALEKKEKD